MKQQQLRVQLMLLNVGRSVDIDIRTTVLQYQRPSHSLYKFEVGEVCGLLAHSPIQRKM